VVQKKINNNAISRILTIRYDPKQKPIRKKLLAKDFRTSTKKDLQSEIISMIKKNLLSKQKKLKFKKISLSLSEGVDSGLTLAMIRTFLPDIKINCISVGFGEKSDEIKRAKELSRIYNCNFKSIIKDDFLKELPKLIYVTQEPRWNLYQYYTFEAGKNNSNVFFTGDGADELFGGYNFRYQKFLSGITKNSNWRIKAKTYISCHERDWVPDQKNMFGKKIKFSWDKIYNLFKPYFNNNLSHLDQVFLADFNGKLLFEWLPINKSISKFLHLKIESIFLTNNMIKLGYHIPWQQKYDYKRNLGKIPLREILYTQKGFERFRPNKKGFSVNALTLWNKNGQEIVNQNLNSNSEIIKNDLINQIWLEKNLNKINSNEKIEPRYLYKIFQILSLEIWYKLFVSHSIKKNDKL